MITYVYHKTRASPRVRLLIILNNYYYLIIVMLSSSLKKLHHFSWENCLRSHKQSKKTTQQRLTA